MRCLPALLISACIIKAYSLFLIFTALAVSAVSATEINLDNKDESNEGFNDQSMPMAGQTGNSGSTLGQQRLNVFRAAADYWERRLTSTVPVLIRINFDPQECTSSSAVLGSAGPVGIFRDCVNAPLANTW
jgi:hypothetical protein